MENNNVTKEQKGNVDVKKAVYWTSNAVLAGVAIPTIVALSTLGAPIYMPFTVVAAALAGSKAAWALTVKKEDADREMEEKAKYSKERMDIAGTMLKNVADKAGAATIHLGKAAGSFVQGTYREIGGAEGAKIAVENVTKGAGEVLKIGSYAVIKGAQMIGNVIEDVSKQIQAENEKSKKKGMLEGAAEFVNFVVMDD